MIQGDMRKLSPWFTASTLTETPINRVFPVLPELRFFKQSLFCHVFLDLEDFS